MFFTIILYATLGFLTLRWLITAINFWDSPILPIYKDKESDETISILIITERHDKHIYKVLSNLLIRPRSEVKEILVYNDFEDKAIAQMVQKMSEQNNLIKLISPSPQPTNWLRHNWVAHQLGIKASFQYLLFIDTNVTVRSQAIHSILTRMKKYKLDLLSIHPLQYIITPAEQLIIPISNYFLLSLVPLRFINLIPLRLISSANNQLMMFKTSNYQKYHFHELCKNKRSTTSIMVKAKAKNLEVDTLLGNKQTFCKGNMLTTGELIKQSSSNFLSNLGHNFFFKFLLYIMITIGGISIYYAHDWQLNTACILAVVSMRWMISSLSFQSKMNNILYHPLQIIVYHLLSWNSVISYWRNKKD